MAQSSGSKKAGRRTGKLSRAEKKEQRSLRRQRRRETFSQMRQAFTLTRQNDAKLLPYLVLAAVGALAVVYVVLLLLTGNVWLPIIPALLFAVIAGMFVFSRRAQSSAYRQAEGQPGAAAYVLGQLRGDWRKRDAVAGTAQLDAVHRLIGRPGVVLVGEGAPHRVKPLLAQEKRRVARLAGDAPIYDVVVGNGADEVPLGKLNTHVMKLPRNLSKEQVAALDRRLAALNAQRAPLPQGPMPTGAKMRNMQRTVRRRG
ncbi:MAG TPA: DUF4191 domain-containing protein [Jatrophihabitans sp.]|nr:DUF4191 domain-containing protein [Jatrophihabitans sp.]